MEININNNTENDVKVGGVGNTISSSSREKVETKTPEEKKRWWKNFLFNVKRTWNENLYDGKINNPPQSFQEGWLLQTNALIGHNGYLYDNGYPPGWPNCIWDYPNVASPEFLNANINILPARYVITRSDYLRLCSDLRTEPHDYDKMKIGVFLKEIYNILQLNEQMPKVRHRHQILWWGIDNSSKVDGRWLTNFIDSGDAAIFGKAWRTLGDDEETRKATLVRHAINETKGKELHSMLKIHDKTFEEIWEEREKSNQVPPPELQQEQEVSKDNNTDNTNNEKNNEGEEENKDDPSKDKSQNTNPENKDETSLGNMRATSERRGDPHQNANTINDITETVGPVSTQTFPETNTATLSDNITYSQQQIKNTPTKNQDWHLSKDLECVTVW